MIRHLCIQSFSFRRSVFEHRYRKCVGTRRRVQCMVQKRRNRNLRLSEFGISDVLLPQDLLGGQFTQSTGEVRLLDFARSTGWRVWEALTDKREKRRLAAVSAIRFERK